MLAVRRAAPVATDQQLVSASVGRDQEIERSAEFFLARP
jgi:hypothetical protein